MSDFKGALWSRLAAAFYLLVPGAALRGPHKATRRKWDELLAAGRRVTAIAGADAHARKYKIGIVNKVGFPYETLFRWVNTHLLVERPLSGDLATDKRLVYDALRAGRTWVGYDRLASTHSFLFQARSGTNVATIGEDLARTAATVFEVTTPKRGSIRLIRNGQVVAKRYGAQLSFTTTEPGVYRVEVYRPLWGEPRGWIFSSPIYVH
jgi:hypothetical protein